MMKGWVLSLLYNVGRDESVMTHYDVMMKGWVLSLLYNVGRDERVTTRYDVMMKRQVLLMFPSTLECSLSLLFKLKLLCLFLSLPPP